MHSGWVTVGRLDPLYKVWGSAPGKFFVGPMVFSMVLCIDLCMVFVHGFGRNGFWSMVLDSSVCIYMYCNIERNIMKNQSSSNSFGIQGKISMYICFMCYVITIVYFLFLEFVCS